MGRKLLIIMALIFALSACNKGSNVADWTHTQAWEAQERPQVLECDEYGNCQRPIISTDGYSN